MKVQAEINRGSFHLCADIRLPDSGISAIFGPSGCGKTSLLRTIAGLDKHSDASVTFLNQTWQSSSVFVPPHKRSVGVVFQEASLFGHLNVQGNLDYALKRVPKHEQKIPFDQVVDLLSLSSLLNKETHVLSGGERQRVAIARALLSSPQLLLMDEPLSALDQVSKREVLNYIQLCHKQTGIPIVYVSHALDEVSQLADYLVLMECGRVVNQGSIESMLTALSSPLALGGDAESIVNATVAGFDERYHVTYLDSAIGRFTVAMSGLNLGEQARLRLAARDISLTLEPQKGSSILNIFPATVAEIKPVSDSLVTVRLTIDGVSVLARLTRKSADIMQLKAGLNVFAQVKSVALL